jgi:hypothetical protein
MLQNGELQHVSCSNFMLVQSHEPILPIGPPWDCSFPDELKNIIINSIIVVIIIIVAHF